MKDKKDTKNRAAELSVEKAKSIRGGGGQTGEEFAPDIPRRKPAKRVANPGWSLTD